MATKASALLCSSYSVKCYAKVAVSQKFNLAWLQRTKLCPELFKNCFAQQRILYLYVSKHWYKVHFRRQKGLAASRPSDCIVMFKAIQRSSSLHSKNEVEKILNQKLILHSSHAWLAVLTQNFAACQYCQNIPVSKDHFHNLFLVKLMAHFK